MLSHHPRLRAALKWAALVVGGLLSLLLITVLIFSLSPIQVENAVPADPAPGYQEAVTRIEAKQAAELATPNFNPTCQSLLLDQGERVENVIVFFHGFTSCPLQFRELGEMLFEQGYAVYMPLHPHHGLTDRRGMALTDLTAEELAAFATESIDIAAGLGEKVTVSGISGGGSLSTWVAQNRDDVALAAPMAPFIGIRLVPGVLLNKGLTNLLPYVPNFYRWWDPIAKENNPASAPYSYVGYPVRSMGAYMQLGFSAENEARRTPPAASAVLLITNAAETSISNAVVDKLQSEWLSQSAVAVGRFELDRDLGLPHDFISTTRQGNPVDVVYPLLLDALTQWAE